MSRAMLNARRAAALAACALTLGLVSPAVNADADADWQLRSNAPGVVMATRFDTAAEVTEGRLADPKASQVVWEESGLGILPASGNGYLRFDILAGDAQSSGNWRRYLADDRRVFGEGDEYWVQYRVWIPRYLRDHVFPNVDGADNPAGWKTSIISHYSASFQNNEIVTQNTKQRGYIQGYANGEVFFDLWERRVDHDTGCGYTPDFVHQPAIDNGPNPLTGNDPDTGQPWTSCQQNRARYGGLASYTKRVGDPGAPDPLSGAFPYYPDEWITILQHVRLGTLDRATRDNLIEVFAHRQGDDAYTLLVSQFRSLGDDHGGHNALWLTPYHTRKCANVGDTRGGCVDDPDREDTFMAFDEVIVSTEFIPAPMAPPPPRPVISLTVSSDSIAAGESVELSWTVTQADTCTAAGDWSGDRDLTGERTVGPLDEDSRFVLACLNTQGGSANASVDVAVGDPSPNDPPPSDPPQEEEEEQGGESPAEEEGDGSSNETVDPVDQAAQIASLTQVPLLGLALALVLAIRRRGSPAGKTAA